MTIIQKDIPVPDTSRGPGRPAKWPFSKMEVGDSVLLEKGKGRACPGNYAHAYGGGTGKKFVTRSQEGGVRIWRVK